MTDKELPDDSGMMLQDGGGLYIHMAYCRSKCIYCDFYSAGDRIADWHGYVDALCSEFRHRIEELAWPLRTVYFGGGTPSLMPEAEFLRLCRFLEPYMAGVEEFTIEVNPDDVCENMLEVWKRGGVTRLSMGIQSFEDHILRSIGRRHDGPTSLRAYDMARKVFDNISIDLMFGLPGQSIEDWQHDIRLALELHPQHISAYCLMYEEGTALTILRDSGRIEDVSEELSEKMFRLLIEELSDAGYEHYEISNFALPGFRSRHNSSYWLQKPYIGLGPSAHSYDGESVRKCNSADLRGYLSRWAKSGGGMTHSEGYRVDIEYLTIEELKEEYVLTRIRTREGIPLRDFSDRFGEDACAKLVKYGRSIADSGLISLSESNLSLTEKAVLMSDSLILALASHC